MGDDMGGATGRIAASVKWQVPVAQDNLAAAIEGRKSRPAHGGPWGPMAATSPAR